jgi:hypothetical protein
VAIAIGKVNLDNRNHVIGNRREIVVDVTLDNSYPTGGYTLTPTTLGVDGVTDYVFAQATTTGHLPVYNYGTKKLMIFSAGTEVANTTDLSAVVLRLIAQGKGTPTF